MGKYFVYVIRSIEGYRYTGMTEDLDLRLKQHNDGSLSFWTKRGSDWELVYKEEFNSKTNALKRAFRKLSRRKTTLDYKSTSNEMEEYFGNILLNEFTQRSSFWGKFIVHVRQYIYNEVV
jgi:putative endonuclease